MAKKHNLGSVNQIPYGEGRVFDLGSRKIAVFRGREHQIYATQPDCPHLGGPLADGLTGSGTLVCPLHDRVFDLKTGASSNADCQIAVYPVHVDGEEIIVTIDP